MMLVDSRVWIDYFNGVKSQATDMLDKSLAEGLVAIGDLIILEILQGIRNDNAYHLTKNSLQALDQYPMLGLALAEKSADNYLTLRKKGITIRKTADVIIATFCIEHQLPLLFTNRDFMPFVEHLGLKSAL